MSMKNKRGQVDWFIVTIIVAIITLGVIIMIIYYFPWGDTLDRTACKASVVLKATLPGDNIPAKDMVSVRCKSRYVCITAKSSGKGNCTEQLGKTYETMRLSAETLDSKKEQIRMFLAREMAECWGIFGEGKLQIFSKSWNSNSGEVSRGIICSKIAFDNTITNGVKDDGVGAIKNLELFTQYMITRKVPNQKISYMDYIINSPEGESAKRFYGAGAVNEKADVISLETVKSIVYIETTLTNLGKRIGGGAGLLVGAFVSRSVNPYILGATTAVGAFAGESIQKWVSNSEFSERGVNAIGGLFLVDYNSDGFKELKIDSFENIN